MQIIRESLREKPYDSKVFSDYFGGLKIAVTDIETTGLYFQKNKVILGGTLHFDGDQKQIVQFFAESREEEAELLTNYVEDLLAADVVITYNGNRFDLPFIRNRLQHHGLDPSPLNRIYSLDLYQIIKNFSPLGEILPNLKQKTIERYMGDHEDRKDEISGADSVKLYNTFCSASPEKKKPLQDKILLHNRDDIVRLSNLIRIFQQLDLHQIVYHYGFPVAAGEKRVAINNIHFMGKKLIAKGATDSPCMDYACYEPGYELSVSEEGRHVKLTLYCEEERGYSFIDLQGLGIDIPFMQKLPGYESGFLIVKDEKQVALPETNYAIKTMFSKLLG